MRVYQLSDIPHGFFADEASIGYNAYTILTNGKDQYGVSYPLFFRAFGEFKGPIQIYSTVPSVWIFGLNEFSIRIVSVFYGILTIPAVYLLVNELIQKEKYRKFLALSVALLLAVSPWHIHMSRIALEGQTAFVFFTTCGLYLFLKAVREQRMPIIILSLITFTLALYSYFPARIFLPLFGLVLVIIYHRYFLKQWKMSIISLLVLAILLLPLVSHIFRGEGFSRWQQVSIFANPPREQSVISHITNNYLSHFSMDFLFLKGDIDMPGQFITRHSVRGMGELYFFQLPFLLLGLFYLKRIDKRLAAILLVWLLFYPIGSMFTTDASAQATRSIIGVVPFQIITAIGILTLAGVLRHIPLTRQAFIATAGIIVALSLFQFKNLYLDKYVVYASDFWGWQYGPKEIMKYFLSNKDRYDDLYMSGEFNSGDIFLKFYDPQNSCGGKCKLGDFYRQPEIYDPSRRQLFSLSPDYISKSSLGKKFHVLKTIYYPNGDIAFQIGEVVE